MQTYNNKKTRFSEMTKRILKLLTENSKYGYPLEEIADKIKLKDFSRGSAARVSLSRCLNMLHKRGYVTWFYGVEDVEINGTIHKIKQKHLGKYWIISAQALNNVELQRIVEKSKRIVEEFKKKRRGLFHLFTR